MTAHDVLKNGPFYSWKDAEGQAGTAKSRWKAESTRTRFAIIPWTLEARAIGLRQAARRFRVRAKGRV